MPFCTQCPKSRFFKDDNALRMHRETKRHFRCRRCNYKFITEGELSAHEKAKHASQFECRFCFRGFSSDKARQQHVFASHHFTCHLCSGNFATIEDLVQHMQTVSHIQCSYCTIKFSAQEAKDAHEGTCCDNPANDAIQPASVLASMACSNPWLSSNDATSTGIVEQEVSTSAVAQRTDEGSELHISPRLSSNSASGEGEMFYSTRGILSAGANGEGATAEQPTHSLEPGPVCQQMPLVSSNTDKPVRNDAGNIISTHDTRKDNPTKISRVMFQCTPCLEMFETREAFQDHVCPAFATMVRPHCPTCRAPFDDRTLLQEHMEGARALLCQLCRTSCCSDEMMQDHLLSHPTCSKCGKPFADNLALCAHVESDHPVVVCWDCDGIVVDKDYLKLHYTDSPVHPSCVFCGVGKRDSADMDEHVKDMHSSSADVEDRGEGGTIDASPQGAVHLAEDHPPVEGQEEAVRKPSEEVDSPPSKATVETALGDHEPSDGLDTRILQTESSLSLPPQPSIPQQVEHVNECVVSDAGISKPLSHRHDKQVSGTSLPSYHCRSCYKDHCEEPTTTQCGHLFCYECISTAIMKDSRCPVCEAPTLLYCLFRIDMSA